MSSSQKPVSTQRALPSLLLFAPSFAFVITIILIGTGTLANANNLLWAIAFDVVFASTIVSIAICKNDKKSALKSGIASGVVFAFIIALFAVVIIAVPPQDTTSDYSDFSAVEEAEILDTSNANAEVEADEDASTNDNIESNETRKYLATYDYKVFQKGKTYKEIEGEPEHYWGSLCAQGKQYELGKTTLRDLSDDWELSFHGGYIPYEKIEIPAGMKALVNITPLAYSHTIDGELLSWFAESHPNANLMKQTFCYVANTTDHPTLLENCVLIYIVLAEDVRDSGIHFDANGVCVGMTADEVAEAVGKSSDGTPDPSKIGLSYKYGDSSDFYLETVYWEGKVSAVWYGTADKDSFTYYDLSDVVQAPY